MVSKLKQFLIFFIAYSENIFLKYSLKFNLISSHIPKNLTKSVSFMRSIFRVVSPSLKKTFFVHLEDLKIKLH